MIKNQSLSSTPDFYIVEKISNFLDSKFRIPGTNLKFGWDPIIGLIPGLGDFVGFSVSALLLLYMTRYGASKKVMLKMSINIILDALIGSIPVLGSFVDFGFKANQRNIALLKEHYFQGKHHGSGKGIVLGILLLLIVLFALLLFSFYKIVKLIFHLF